VKPFSYTRAQQAAQAVALVSSNPNAAYLAGGTELVNWLKDGLAAPDLLVDINALPLTGVEILPTGLRIGALTRMSDLAAHPTVRAEYPVLAEALLAGASPQLRNAATIGGNLLQRTRCPYFRDTAFPCNRREPSSGCAAQSGHLRESAIFGASDDCVATHPSDLAVALVALDAVVMTAQPRGERAIPIGDFHLLPGSTPQREHLLEPGELIVAVHLPTGPFAARSHYLKLRDRASYEFALVSVAAALELVDGTVRAARLALGGVAAKPWRALEAEAELVGRPFGPDTVAAAAAAAVRGARTRPDNAFKIPLVERAVVRALSTVGGLS
jgi:xanthine dehydrogenase YagS FAD-binding subunit